MIRVCGAILATRRDSSHHDVGEEKIKTPDHHVFQGNSPVIGSHDFVARLRQGAGQKCTKRSIVLCQ